MASDYDRIRADNIREYGEGTRHLAFLGRLYTERTHFLFELLQNAEDAGATGIHFELFPDRLEVWHNGRIFNEHDVRGVCGVGEGTKAEDFTKIGKFGIGFKSVYAYTLHPHIHSGDEHFRIEHDVRPYAVQASELKPHSTTLFFFPFDHTEIQATQAFEEIGRRLETLNARTMLFLRNLTEIDWSIEGRTQGTYIKESQHRGSCRQVKVLGEGPASDTEEDWLIFERPLNRPDMNSTRVEVAFRADIDKKTSQKRVVRTDDDYLVVFFPTDKETNLGFLIQGPYRTTPARDNIPRDDSWNQRLIEETAILVKDALLALREMDLVSVSMLGALPLDESAFPLGSMFRPLFECVRATLHDYPLLPSRDGTVVTAKQARLARSTGLADLFTPMQLAELLSHPEPVHWLTYEISPNGTPALYQYLVEQRNYWLGVSDEAKVPEEQYEIRPRTLLRELTPTFLKKQPDAWFVRFYRFLLDQRDGWPILQDKPYIRLQKDSHVLPKRPDGSPSAYLPPASETDLPIVKRSIASDRAARSFLEGIGFSEPNVIAEVLEHVLNKYIKADKSGRLLPNSQHQHDLQKIISALESASLFERTTLINRLKQTPFLLAVNASAAKSKYLRPTEVYLRNSDLEVFFAGNPDAWFMNEEIAPGSDTESDDYLHSWLASRHEPKRGWMMLGVSRTPRFFRVERELTWGERRELRLKYGNDGCTGREEVIDEQIDGLEFALGRVSNSPSSFGYKTALVIWNRLITYKNQLDHWQRSYFGQATYKWYYRTDHYTRFKWATWMQCLRDTAWLPSPDGKFWKPSDIDLDMLPSEFDRDHDIISALGLGRGQSEKIERAAHEVNLDPKELDFFLRVHRDHPEWLAELRQKVAAQDDLASKDISMTNNLSKSKVTEPVIDYVGLLHEMFSGPASDASTSSLPYSSFVSDPARRRERVAEEIRQDQQDEPPLEQRFTRVPHKVWEGKDRHIRTFLEQEYGGRCQICGNTFPKRDGVPYFEGMYLVRHTEARWIDRPGNVLCLCPTCCAKLQHGAVEAHNIVGQIKAFQATKEGGSAEAVLHIQLCGESSTIRFSERHMIDLQELVRATPDIRDEAAI